MLPIHPIVIVARNLEPLGSNFNTRWCQFAFLHKIIQFFYSLFGFFFSFATYDFWKTIFLHEIMKSISGQCMWRLTINQRAISYLFTDSGFSWGGAATHTDDEGRLPAAVAVLRRLAVPLLQGGTPDPSPLHILYIWVDLWNETNGIRIQVYF